MYQQLPYGNYQHQEQRLQQWQWTQCLLWGFFFFMIAAVVVGLFITSIVLSAKNIHHDHLHENEHTSSDDCDKESGDSIYMPCYCCKFNKSCCPGGGSGTGPETTQLARNELTFHQNREGMRLRNNEKHKRLFHNHKYTDYEKEAVKKRLLIDESFLIAETKYGRTKTPHLPVNTTSAINNVSTAVARPVNFTYCGSFEGFTTPNGACPPIGNQACCGNCYAWAATEMLESQYWLLHKSNTFPDCSVRYTTQVTLSGNFSITHAQVPQLPVPFINLSIPGGCAGAGAFFSLYGLLTTTGGAIPSSVDPLGGLGGNENNNCNDFNKNAPVSPTYSIPLAQTQVNVPFKNISRITDVIHDQTSEGVCKIVYGNITQAEIDLYNALWAHGPTAVAIYGLPLTFFNSPDTRFDKAPNYILTADDCINIFPGGCLASDTANINSYPPNQFCCPDHVVLLVGYGHDPVTGLDYWIVQNQWGTGVGNGGYFYIERGRNACGIATNAYRPEF